MFVIIITLKLTRVSRLRLRSMTVYRSMEAVLESKRQLRELRSEHFFSRLCEDAHLEVTKYGLQDIMLPRLVNAKILSRYSHVTQQRGLKTAPQPTFETAEDYYKAQFFAFIYAVI
jgi:hypothetical protein